MIIYNQQKFEKIIFQGGGGLINEIVYIHKYGNLLINRSVTSL